MMADMENAEPHPHEFEEVGEEISDPRYHLDLQDLKSVTLTITANLGECKMLVRDVLALREGAVIQLDRLAGEMTDIYVNGLPLARGEVVVIGDNLHVRVGEIAGHGGRPEDFRSDASDEETGEDDEEI
jgi:flagellar motor switch protein FliN/FliY